MKLKLYVASLLLAFTCATGAIAEEHPLGTITGNQIELKTSDHAIAGSIKNFVMWGFVDEETFSSEIIMRKDEQLVRAIFKKQDDGRTGGVIEHTVNGKVITTSLYLAGINKEENKILLKINGQDAEVAIVAPLVDGHFQNPTYKTVFNGEEISFTMQGGACYGFSFHLTAMILAAYLH